jgi:hypothetical protein
MSPFVISQATEVELSDSSGGNKKTYWKKEILPSGTRQYKGQTLNFAEINPACVSAFQDGAFDAVPFVLALTDNQHPEAGQETETLDGDLHKLELSTDGRLYGYFDLSESEKALPAIKKSNGKFGVSCKIEVGYKREDTGKDYPYALSHVCGTTRPHIKGMEPWQAVELSEDEKKTITIDLSTEVVDETEGKEELVTLQITKEELDGLRKFMADYASAEKVAANLSENDGGNGTGDAGKESGDGTVKLSETDSLALTEARRQADMAMQLARRSQIELAETRWAARERELALAGVPPVMLAEAKKVLSLPMRSTITLSEGSNERVIDASEVIEKLLEAAKGTVKLTSEEGHNFGGNGEGVEDAAYKAFEAQLLAGM